MLLAAGLAARAAALTPSGTIVNVSDLSITADGGAVSVSEPSDPASFTVQAVSGLAWLTTATDTTTATGQTVIYEYEFSHNGNIGLAPTEDNFYITVSGTWLDGVYQDALCTVPATGSVSLPPNVGNTYTFYVKVITPAGSEGQSSATTIEVENEYYNTNGADDPYGDPDRITHSVITIVPDTTAPALAITAPANGANLTTASAALTGTTEPGATGYYSVSPSGATGTISVDALGNITATVPLDQGANTIGVTARDAFLNTATASVVVNVDSIAPTVAISSPAMSAQLVGLVSVTGTATDDNFQEYSLHYGPGLSPTAWGTITATSTVPVADSLLGSWDTSTLYGDYVLELTAVDTFGNVGQATITVSAGNNDTFTGTLPAGEWTMVSVPGIPYNPDPHSWLGSGRYEVQRWDPTMSAPDPYLYQYLRSFSVSAGKSFWVKPYDGNISYNVSAWVPDTTQEYSIPVNQGWNQIGNPYDRAITWDYFQVQDNVSGVTKTMAQAVADGWIDSSFYSYAGGNYAQHIAGQALSPQQGYFVKSYVDGYLLIDPGAGMPEGVARIIRPRYAWKLQLSASGGGLSDTDNFAAALKGSRDDLDPADAGEPPLVEPYLTLYFPHEDWAGAARGRYASDVRPDTDTDHEQVKVWTFEVRASEPGTPVTLSWPNAAQLPDNYEYTIEDETTGQAVDPRTAPSLAYTAEAAAPRRFRLTARKTAAATQVDLAMTLAPGWNLISVPLEPEQTDARDQLGDDFSNPAIFQYYDLEYYDPDSAERVDIQAGIGYWLFAEAETQVDFRGVPTRTDSAVEVPLAAGWNLIGNPFDTEMLFGDNIMVDNEGGQLPLSEAVEAGWLEGRVFSYDTASGAYQVLGQGAPLPPLQGLIIRALAPCTLIME